jgi:hypothetical protein
LEHALAALQRELELGEDRGAGASPPALDAHDSKFSEVFPSGGLRHHAADGGEC